MRILHLTHRTAWDVALAAGTYEISTRGHGLAEVGFIHCSRPEQLAAVAEYVHAGDTEELCVLVMDAEAIRAAGTSVVVEDGGNGQEYPHIYGPIDPAWVERVEPAWFDGEEFRSTALGPTVVATTERLTLRTWREADLPGLAAINSHPDVYGALGGVPIGRADSDRMASWANRLYGLERIGLLAVERTADGVVVGMCGLHHQQAYPDEVEVGWRLDPAFWGLGYATEAAGAWLDVAFGPLGLGLPRVISITDVENTRSLAVMSRLGMTYDHGGRIVDGNEEFDGVVYSITAYQWQAGGHQ